MAKEQIGQTRPEHAETGRALGELLVVLRDLVERDKVLCPSSIVHSQETDFDSRLAPVTFQILKELSDGLSLFTYRQIQYQQTVRALRRYLGLPTEPEDGRWEHAFPRNPHEPLKRPRVYVHLSLPDEFTEDDRRRKTLIYEHSVKLREASAERLAPTFAESRRLAVGSVVKFVYWDPLFEYPERMAAMMASPMSSSDLRSMSPQQLLSYYNDVTLPLAFELLLEYARLRALELNEIGPDHLAHYFKFFDSPEFDSIPHYDVFCSLNAGFRFYKPERKPKPSDAYDFAALATVLPYIDIVTTDRAMKDMLLQTGLDKKYGVEVYTPRLADVKALAERLSKMG